MKQLTREDVVQAMAVLGVRLSGFVTSEVFGAAREEAVGAFKRLMMENHPDRHAAAGLTARANARTLEVSAAEHLLKSCPWFQVSSLFSVRVSNNAPAREWGMWSGIPTRQGARYYARCPMCATLVQEGERHSCKINVDPIRTKERPFSYERPGKGQPAKAPECGQESPLGVRCTEPQQHAGEHRGFGRDGRHSWKANFVGTFEQVDIGGGR